MSLYHQANRTVPISAGTALTLTPQDAGRIVKLDSAAGSTVTLPSATGGGNYFEFWITVTATSGSHVIKVGNASDEMRGYIIADADTATAPNIWAAADNDDTITFNRTTTGTAAQGHWVVARDLAANHWYVKGLCEQSGEEATPFSATVS